MDQVKRASFLLLVAAALTFVGGGCKGADSVPGHTAAEDAAIAAQKKLTPEQQIEQIQKSPQPEGAKAALIQRIKDQNGMK